jgi:hypothetical protein
MLLWSQYQSLSNLDYHFLSTGQELDRQETVAKMETARLQEVESRLAVERQRSLEQRRSLRRQRILLGVVSLAMMVAIWLGFFAQSQYRQASLSEARAIVRTAEALLASKQSFESMLEAIRGQRRLQQWQGVDPALQVQADAILERVVLSIRQRNRLDGHQAAIATINFSTAALWCLSRSLCSFTLFARFRPLARPFRAIVRPLSDHYVRVYRTLSL